MPLDRYQIEEFDNHWSGTYGMVGDKPVYVHSVRDREARQFNGRNVLTGRDMACIMDDIDVIKLPVGFYSSESRGLSYYGRTPAQHYKRGINPRNTVIGRVEFNGSSVVIRNTGIDDRMIADLYKFHHPKKMTPKHFDSQVLKLSEVGQSFALNHQYAMAMGEARDRSIRPMIYCHSGPVGYIDEAGRIKLHKSLPYLKDALHNSIKELYGKEIEVYV